MTTTGRVKIVGVAALCVFAALVGFVTVKRSLERHGKSSPREAKDPFAFGDLYNGKFSYKGVSITWVSGNEYIYRDSNGDIKKNNVEDSTEETIMSGTVYSDNNARSYKVSADLKYVALLTNYKKGWRHSYNGTYIIYDVDAAKVDNNLVTPDNTQYFVWAPTGNALAYVNGFDIYYRSSVSDVAERVTSDGRSNYIYNGIPDWVYEEEMISSNNVMYFSPSGSYLAFAQFDDSACERINFARFDAGNYPSMQVVSYPKASTIQPTNKVFVYDVVKDTTYDVDPPQKFDGVDYLFNRITWAENDKFAVSWSNRNQTEGVIHMVTVNSTTGFTSAETNANFEHSSSTGWLYQRRPYWIPVFGDTTDEYYTVRPNGNWQHLYLVSKTGATAITEGDFTVTSESASYPAVEIYDKATKKIYFSATKESPQHRHIYRNSATPSEPECVTCKYASQYPGRCDYISTTFSTDGSYVLVRCAGDELPPMYIMAQIDHTATDPDSVFTNEKVMEDNAALVTTLDNTDISTKEYGTFTSTSGYDFTYQLWKPPNFDANKKYPLLIDVYAGPGYQNVYNRWSMGWSSRFVPSSLDVVVASVDGRGSNFYGEDFMHEVYKILGVKEPVDQLEFADYMSKMAWIDETRVAVWGWSYGGYTTSMILANDGPAESDRLIKCGLAVAPLTDWRFYDTIYAERYMALVDGNEAGYDGASVLKKADKFPNSRYVLIHGTADDNVHFQNAARLQSALVEQNIDFKAIYYGDQDHSINVGNANQHIYKVLTRELTRCFDMEVPSGVWSPPT